MWCNHRLYSTCYIIYGATGIAANDFNFMHTGVINNQLTYYHEDDSEKSPSPSSATGIKSTLNVSYFMLSSLSVFIKFIYVLITTIIFG